MKNKNTAGILAFFFGFFGTHKFYLGKTAGGFTRLILFLIFLNGRGGLAASIIIGLFLYSFIEAIILFSMNKEEFNQRYNTGSTTLSNKNRAPASSLKKNYQAERSEIGNWKKEGMQKFRDYDFDGAIELFQKVLAVAPDDIPSHFNIACAYSLLEKTKEALNHLDAAVRLGFKDIEKIRNHDAFAFLRIQPEYQEFAANHFKLDREQKQPSSLEMPSEDFLQGFPPNQSLLARLKELKEMREQGILSEEEFSQFKKKLLG